MSSPYLFRDHQNRQRAYLSTLTAAGLVLLLSITGPSLGNASGRVRHRNNSHVPPVAAARQEFSLAYRFAPGTRLRYTLVYQTESASDFGNVVKAEQLKSGSPARVRTIVMSPLAHSFKTYLGGTLLMTVLDKSDAGVLVVYSVRDPVVKLEAQGQQDETQLEKIRNDLTRPVFAIVSSQGRILSVRLDASSQGLSRNLIKATLATTEFVLAAEEGSTNSRRWEAEEEDGNGSYVGAYTEVFDSRSNRPGRFESPDRMFRKARVSDLRLPVGRNRNGVYEIAPAISATGGFLGHFDTRQGRLRSLTGTETQEFTLAGHVVGVTRSTLRYRLFKSEQLTAAGLSELRQASIERESIDKATGLRTRQSEEETEAALQRTNLGDATLASLQTALDSTSASGAANTQLYLKFRALAYLHPETCVKLGQILSISDGQDRASDILIDALASVGHEQAQAALVTAIKAHADDDAVLTRLLLAIGRSVALSQLTEETLREIATRAHTLEIAALALNLLNKTR